MLEQPSRKIEISVDIKRNRIRIHKYMMSLMGMPRYIQLLVSPKDRAVAVRGLDSEIKGDQSYKINPKQLQSEMCIELYSQPLMEELKNLVPEMEDIGTYHLFGAVSSVQRVAVFPISTIRKLDKSESAE